MCLLLIVSGGAFAFECPRGDSLESRYKGSQRVFLAYVLDTKLEEKLQQKMVQIDHGKDVDAEYVKLVSAGYRVIENFKGDDKYQPRLLDLLGIGTGYVGLTPGVYYVVFLADPKQAEDMQIEEVQMRHVDLCSVPISHYRLSDKEFQEKLKEVRGMEAR